LVAEKGLSQLSLSMIAGTESILKSWSEAALDYLTIEQG
jgi:hypothetical protein